MSSRAKFSLAWAFLLLAASSHTSIAGSWATRCASASKSPVPAERNSKFCRNRSATSACVAVLVDVCINASFVPIGPERRAPCAAAFRSEAVDATPASHGAHRITRLLDHLEALGHDEIDDLAVVHFHRHAAA